jgi:hypothetical protein
MSGVRIFPYTAREILLYGDDRIIKNRDAQGPIYVTKVVGVIRFQGM